MTEGFYAHIAADVWLAKGKAALTLLACYLTLKLLTEYEESYLAPIKNVLGFCHLTGFGTWPDTKCLEQTLSFSSLSSAWSSQLMAESHARLLLIVNSSSISPPFFTIFGTRLNLPESFFFKLFSVLLLQPTMMHRTMAISNNIGVIFRYKER